MAVVDRGATVAALFEHLSALDIDGVAGFFTDDVVMEIAFQPEGQGFWSRTEGKSALHRFFGSLPVLFDGFAISATRTYPLADPDGVIVRYRGDARVRATGKPYCNNYIGVFIFAEDGRIREWTEFHNPLVLLAAFNREPAE
jgi:ketosteroid isomerase-like protein